MAGELERLLIRIEADTSLLRKGLDDADKRVAGFSDNVDRQISRSERRFKSFAGVGNRLLSGLAVGYLVRETGQLADAYTNMGNRLKFVTQNSTELEYVQGRLFEIAQGTRVGLQDTTELYARMAFALRDVGASQNQVLKFTENLNKALILSGASGAEASGALVQLSQGLAAGTLRGQELNSVMEQTPYLASLIAKQLGVTTGELRKLGMQGKITGRDVFQAITNASNELNDRFSETVPTVSQGFTTISNSLVGFVGRLNKSSHAGERLAKVLRQIAGVIDSIDLSQQIGKLQNDPLSATPFGIFRDAIVGPTESGWEGKISANADNGTTVDDQLETTEKLNEAWKEINANAMDALETMVSDHFDTAATKIDKITDAVNAGRISFKQWGDLTKRVNADFAAQAFSTADAVISASDSIFQNNKGAAIASAIANTAVGVTRAFAALDPPFNFIQAAAVAAAGLAQVQTIRSTSKSGGGGGAAPVPAIAAAPSASTGSSSDSGPRQAVHLTLQGRRYDREEVREILEGLNDLIKDGAQLYVD